MRTHQSSKLLNDTIDQTQAVVVRHNLEQVLDRLVLTGGLHDLIDDGGFVLGIERRRGEDGVELLVLGQSSLQLLESLVGGLERRGLCARGVLHSRGIDFVSGARNVRWGFWQGHLSGGWPGRWVGGEGMYESGGVIAVDAEEGHGRLDGSALVGGGGIVPHALAGDLAGDMAGGEHGAGERRVVGVR